MTEEKKKNKFLRVDLPLLLISLVLAVFFWFFLSLTAFPEINMIIRDVPIDMSLEDSYAAVKGLSVISSDTEQVNVSINGFRYQIGSYTSEDIHVGLNLETIRESGSYTVPLIVTSVHGDTLSDVIVEPETVHIEVDRFATKTLSVENGDLTVDLNNIRTGAGYIIDPEEVEINPSEITISGPQDYIEQVTSCVLSFDSSVSLRESSSLTPTTTTLYSGSNVFETPRIDIDAEEFSVYVPVYMTKELPLNIIITGYNDIDFSGVPYQMSVDSILVRGQDKLEDIDSINLGYIDIRDVVPGSVFTFPIVESSYYTNISGIDTVDVMFDLENYTTKRITLKNTQIHTINGSSAYDVTIEQDRLGVTVVGPAEILDTIDSDSFVAQINLADYDYSNDAVGTRFLTATVYAPNYRSIWAYGTSQVLVSYAMTNPPTAAQQNREGEQPQQPENGAEE